MAEQTGRVVEAQPGGLARVVTDRKGACGGCHSNQGSGCISCLAQAKMEIQVANPIGARAGDVVRFSLRSSDFFKGAAMLYLFPMVTLLAGALIGAWTGKAMGWQETLGAVAGVVAGLSLAVFVLIRLDRSAWARQRLAPRMTAVLFSDRSQLQQPSGAQHACCRR